MDSFRVRYGRTVIIVKVLSERKPESKDPAEAGISISVRGFLPNASHRMLSAEC